jgi:hypothetical protein
MDSGLRKDAAFGTDWIKDTVDGAWNAGVKPFANMVGTAAKGVGNVLGGAGRTVWNAATAPIHAVGAGMAGAWNRRGEGLGGMVQGAWDRSSNAVKTDMQDMRQGMWQAGKGGLQTVGGTLGAAGAMATAPLGMIGGGIYGALSNPSAKPPAQPQPNPATDPEYQKYLQWQQQQRAGGATAQGASQPQPNLNAPVQPAGAPRTFDTFAYGKPGASHTVIDVEAEVLTPFAGLDKQASSVIGNMLRSTGRFLTNSAAKARTGYKQNFQQFYKGLSKEQRAAHPGLKSRAMFIQSHSPAAIGEKYGIGNWRHRLGGGLDNWANKAEELKLLHPGLHTALTGAAMAAPAVGAGALWANMRDDAYNSPPYNPYPTPGRADPTAWETVGKPGASLRGVAFAALEKNANTLPGKLFAWGGKALRGSAGKAQRAGLQGARDAATGLKGKGATKIRNGLKSMTPGQYGKEAEIGLTRLDMAKRLGGWQKKVDAFAADRPGLYRGLSVGIPTAAGGGMLYGANRMGHTSGRRQGLAEGYDVGAETGAAAALSQIPEQGVMDRILSVFRGQQGPDAAAVRNLIDQSKGDILQTILRGTTG